MRQCRQDEGLDGGGSELWLWKGPVLCACRDFLGTRNRPVENPNYGSIAVPGQIYSHLLSVTLLRGQSTVSSIRRRASGVIDLPVHECCLQFPGFREQHIVFQ